MFRRISLRSRQDLFFILSLAANPGSIAPRYVQWIHAVQKGTGAPWIHLLCAKIRQGGSSPAFPSYQYHTIEFAGPEPLASHFARTGVHASLPLQLPAFSSGVAKLVLSDLTLPNVGTVIRIAQQLPSLEFLLCESLSWVSPPDKQDDAPSIPARHTIPAGSGTLGFQMNNCTHDWTVVLISGAFLSGQAFKSRLANEEFQAMGQLTRVMTENVRRETQSEHVTFSNLSAHVVPISLCAFFYMRWTLEISADLTPQHVLWNQIRSRRRTSVSEL